MTNIVFPLFLLLLYFNLNVLKTTLKCWYTCCQWQSAVVLSEWVRVLMEIRMNGVLEDRKEGEERKEGERYNERKKSGKSSNLFILWVGNPSFCPLDGVSVNMFIREHTEVDCSFRWLLQLLPLCPSTECLSDCIWIGGMSQQCPTQLRTFYLY